MRELELSEADGIPVIMPSSDFGSASCVIFITGLKTFCVSHGAQESQFLTLAFVGLIEMSLFPWQN